MKKTYILIAVAMLAALSMTGCKNNNKKSQEPTQEEIQAQKQALADSVLAKIDAMIDSFITYSSSGFVIPKFELSQDEKMVKPDYLLDPSEANKLVTKSQKVNALAIYLIDMGVRKIYDMPVDETKEAIARIAVDINYPVDFDTQNLEAKKPSDRIRAEYDKCRENGDIAFFWQFQNAVIYEIDYLVAQNPDLFFDRITDEQWKAYMYRQAYRWATVRELAKYDDEIAVLYDFMEGRKLSSSDDDWMELNATKESTRKWRIDNKAKFIANRNSLLQ